MTDPERQPEPDDPRPWEGAGLRRDCSPHRGTALDLLSVAALLLGIAALCVGLPGLIGLPLAAVAWRHARRDLAQMHAGLMDPSGMVSATNARGTGFAAIVLNAAGLLAWGALFFAILTR